jgi:hypothetical protein
VDAVLVAVAVGGLAGVVVVVLCAGFMVVLR